MKEKILALVVVLGSSLGLAAKADQVITCASWGHGFTRCVVNFEIDYVRIYRQYSGANCFQGRDWGYDRSSVWVDNGCRADFLVTEYRNGPGPSEDVICDSYNFRFNQCHLRYPIHFAELVFQQSSRECQDPGAWGYDRYNIWVDRGCRGMFRVYYY